ncbi:MAG: hypothetical protein ACLUOI_24955 [Eisenbergiella sp.]
MNDPAKQWKITDEDWRNRRNGMPMRRPSTRCWCDLHHLRAVDDCGGEFKYYARVKVLRTVVEALEEK